MSFLGLTLDKLLIIGLLAVLLVGPDKLPMYAEKLGNLVRSLRDMANGAKSRLQEEMGEDFDVDWRKLDPRQYDPRRIVRDALLDEPKPALAPSSTPRASKTHNFAASAAASAAAARTLDGPAPFDSEAT